MTTLKGSCVVAQSGGPTAVINSSIAGVVQEAAKHEGVGEVFGAVNGILGVLKEELVDLGRESPATIERLRVTPSAALGSCRRKLSEEDFARVLEVLMAHGVRYFFIAGGNDSMDTANNVFRLAQGAGYELRVIGIPKTVDNDLPATDHCPGYGSVARWLAIATRDAGRDTEAIYTSDTVKVIETMGRDTGWITAATALAKEHENGAPHLIYLPEIPFDRDKFLADVDRVYAKLGMVVITVCEGLRDTEGRTITASAKAVDVDGFGHVQLGGVAATLCDIIAENLKIKARWDKPGTIQRVSQVCVSPVDAEEAYRVGQEAVRQAVKGKSGFMVTLLRRPTKQYSCETGSIGLCEVANQKKDMPRNFINREGNYVTKAFLDYVEPLIGGELPEYAKLRKQLLRKKLPSYGE